MQVSKSLRPHSRLQTASEAAAVSPAAKGQERGGESDGQAFLSFFIFPVCGRHRVIPSPLSFLDSDETERMATAPSGQWSQRISCPLELEPLSRALQHRASPANTDEGKTTRRSLMVQWPGVSGPRDVGHGLVGPSLSVCPHAWSWVISFEQRRSLSTKQLFFVVVIEKC